MHALFHCLVITLVCDTAGGQAAERGSMLKRRGRVGGQEGGRREVQPVSTEAWSGVKEKMLKAGGRGLAGWGQPLQEVRGDTHKH